jgi:hypothetical protein
MPLSGRKPIKAMRIPFWSTDKTSVNPPLAARLRVRA